MDTGDIVAMDASNYLHNHGRGKTKAAPALSAEEAAAAAVPEGMNVTEQELTWFTGDTGTTTLCWRFACKGEDEDRCVIYADSSDGQQIDIRMEDVNVSDV